MTASAAVYLDNAATTRPLPEAIEAMQGAHLDDFGNPSSAHLFGEGARRRLDDAREFLRGSVGAAQLVLTSGGTEADVLGVSGAVQDRPPGRVLAGAADHPAILAQRELLARTHHALVEVPVDDAGTMEPEALFDLLGRDVRGVAILHGHNEVGGLARVDELVSLVRRVAPGAHVHVDLVQSYGKVPFDLDDAGVDSVAVSGHKLHGPRGVGFLALSSTAAVAPIQRGGGQEGGLRGGTENVAGAVGLAVAAERALSHLATSAAHMERLLEWLLARVRRDFPRAVRLGVEGRRLPHVLSLRLPGIVGETLQQRCSARGVAFSTGAACHGSEGGKAEETKTNENHVLRAIGMERRAAREVVRMSVSPFTAEADVAHAAEILCEEAGVLQRVAAAP